MSELAVVSDAQESKTRVEELLEKLDNLAQANEEVGLVTTHGVIYNWQKFKKLNLESSLSQGGCTEGFVSVVDLADGEGGIGVVVIPIDLETSDDPDELIRNLLGRSPEVWSSSEFEHRDQEEYVNHRFRCDSCGSELPIRESGGDDLL